jgi:UDP-glucose 4-epimerase
VTHYLVTGGCGFIGSHLCDMLVEGGHRVTVLDDLSTGRVENLPAACRLVVGDVRDPAAVRAAMEGVRGCFHLAAIASVDRSTRDWVGAHTANQTGTVTVLDAARGGAGRDTVPVVFASSAAVYGDPAILPLPEVAPLRPTNAYGADKLGSELHARIASSVHGIPTMGFRFFNVYGPRQDPASPYSGVISIFADRLRRGLPITVHGDGQQVRDFVYVGDVVRHLVAGMARVSIESDVLNVCTGRPTTIRDLARSMANLLGVRPTIVTGPARAGDIRVSVGNPTRATSILGVRAETPLGTGLAHLLGVGMPTANAA